MRPEDSTLLIEGSRMDDIKRRETTAKAVNWIKKYSDMHKIFDRVPELPLEQYISDDSLAAIIDLETMGLDYKSCKILEIGIIVFSISSMMQFRSVNSVYSELNDPKMSIPENITKLTGINNKLVEGKKIAWDAVGDLIEPVDYVICHNAGFDRKFLEAQTPSIVSELFKKKKFGCTKNDIDWKAQGFANTKLDYLNWSNDHFYDAHRAINDCWATLNIIKQTGSIPELIDNINRLYYTYRLCNTDYNQKEKIKAMGFRWEPTGKYWILETNEKQDFSGIKGMAACDTIDATIRYSSRRN